MRRIRRVRKKVKRRVKRKVHGGPRVDAAIQNSLLSSTAKNVIAEMTIEERIEKKKELEETGLGYNKNVETLLALDTILPYDFVLYCYLVESLMEQQPKGLIDNLEKKDDTSGTDRADN